MSGKSVTLQTSLIQHKNCQYSAQCISPQPYNHSALYFEYKHLKMCLQEKPTVTES